jgi:serine/threonine-protein kinase
MTPARWQQIKKLLDEAWQRAGEERRAFLDGACSGDPALRAYVDALLAADAIRVTFGRSRHRV